MKVVFVPDPTSPNGEDAFCREMGKRAAARGHETSVVVVPNGPTAATVELLRAQGFASSADAVVVNSLQPAALLAARAIGKPGILRLIESYAGASAEALDEVKRFALAADRVLVPSRWMSEMVSGWGVAPERLKVVPYAYDQIFAQQIALVTMRASRPSGFGLVTVGLIDEISRPGFEVAFSAVSRLRLDCHLAVIGDGPSLPQLKEKAKAMMLGDKVSFLGDLPHPKKMEYLRAAKAFIEPSGRQGFPSLALHALSEGCPVIGVRAGALPELIKDGVNGLLYPPGEPAMLADQILNLSTTTGLSLRLIAEGVRTVESHSWDATVSATFEALESLEARI